MDRLEIDAATPAPCAGDAQSSPPRVWLTGSNLLNATISTAVIVSGLNGLVQIVRVIIEVSTEHAR